jgi:peptide deformylase
MAILDIVKVPHPVLREKAKKVAKVTPSIQRLLDDMAETMRVAPGVGLAGPQVGILQRVIVVEVPKDDEYPDLQYGFYQVVNPEIVRVSRDKVEGLEGCLSVPGYIADIERAVGVEVRGLDRNGKPLKVKARDYLARVFQHEIDHLDGILFLDRLASPDKLHKLPENEAAQDETDMVA